MSDVPADLIEQAAAVLASWGVRSRHGSWTDREAQEQVAREVLGALDLPGLLNAAKAEAWGACLAERRRLMDDTSCACDTCLTDAIPPAEIEEGNDRG